MRLIMLCLLGLFTLALTMPVAAEAASTRSTSRASAKVMKPAARAAAAPARSIAATCRPAAVIRVAPARSSARVTTSRQTAKAGNRNMIAGRAAQGQVMAERSNMTARGARLTSWTAGLPAASGEQRDCPAGTMSTLARGHDDVIRCMPL
jgi:hypothetical protein